MLFDDDLNGRHLPEKSICLTFDDGPGPHTEILGQYLFENGVQAVFFVIGQLAAEEPAVLRRLRDWGHVIGNHSWSHPGLVDLALAGGDVVAEIARTDVVIRPLVSGPILLRPPYGSWRQSPARGDDNRRPFSPVGQLLRESKRFEDYVGPVMWDIVGEDWKYWEEGRSLQQCLHRQVDEIERVGRGIVLLHDGSEDPVVRAKNRAAELTALLVPVLKSRGFRFVSPESVIPTSLYAANV